MSMMSLLSVLAGEAPAGPLVAKRTASRKKSAPGFLAKLFAPKAKKVGTKKAAPLTAISRSSGKGIGDQLLNRRR